jgi:pyruvate dehydrogenase E2 component (dihydrolipoamide acetyltransferase)
MRMPEIAANMTEAVLQEWVVAENVSFEAGEAIATVETEKALVDVEADQGGVILRALVPGGSKVAVGAPIAVLGDRGESVDDLDAVLAELGVGAVEVTAAPERRDVPEPAPADPEGGTADTVGPAVPTRVFSSPLARRIASEGGLAIDTITGTGPRGRVLRRDVEAAISTAAAPMPASAPVPEPARNGAPQSRHVPAGSAGYVEVPHSRMRRAVAARLTGSKQTVPHFYLRATLRVAGLLRMRAELNEGGGPKISVNDLVLKAVARAHVLVPEMNVTWTEESVRQYDAVDVAVAVATERGLLTPVVRGVDSLSVTAVSAAVKDLVARAQQGKLRQEELEGGSVSVSNLGMYDVEEFAAIINPPQASILAVGGIRTEAVVVDGNIVAEPVMRVTLSVDHRPVDGVVAARWMQVFEAVVNSPARILA